MNELEKKLDHENDDKFIIYHSKKIKINEIKLKGDNPNFKKETPKNNIKENEFEGINTIDETFFNKLSECDEQDNIEKEKEKEKENELLNEKLIEEFLKKKDDPKFLEKLGKKGLKIKTEDEEEEECKEKSIIKCNICYFTIDNSENKLEVGKCGHAFCQKCWGKMEDAKGKAKCPICREIVKKKDRNVIYVSN